MKRLICFLVVVAGVSAVTAVPVFATNDTHGQKLTSSTTLDACGYFVGTQTANKTVTSGADYSEKGTWAGVTNNYVNTPVASLGTVTGSYSETETLGPGDSFSGTETFHSDAGTINQLFSFDGTSFTVTVTATGALSFLTSDTNGGCYTGPVPRP